MNSPTISVCIPVYNGASYLDDCLRSVIAQTYANIEILLVDDGSTDDSISIIKKWAAQDARIRLIQNEKNLGLTGNWIKCIEQSRGAWIKFLFQDDLMRADCVEKMYNACSTHHAFFCICARDFLIEPSASERLQNYFRNKVIHPEDYFTSEALMQNEEVLDLAEKNLLVNFLGEPIVTFFAKGIVGKTGTFNIGMPQLVDYEFILRAALTVPTCFIPEKLVTFRVHGGAESDSHYENAAKRVKNDLIEPLIIYHEYLFDPRFSALRKRTGKIKLFRLFFTRYRKSALNYHPQLIRENFKIVSSHYTYLSTLVRIAEKTLLLKRIRVKYLA
jgi:glycosyltransferase involved in cell wall biosynthesis